MPASLRALIGRCLAKTPGAGRIIRKPLVAALAVAAVAGVGAAAGVLLELGRRFKQPGERQLAEQWRGGDRDHVAAGQHGLRGRHAAAGHDQSPAEDESAAEPGCLRDRHLEVGQTGGDLQREKKTTVITGSGAVSTFLADGTITTTYSNEVFRATVDGVAWTEVLRGGVGGHWAVENGDILYSSLTSDGTEVLDADGVYKLGPAAGAAGGGAFSVLG